MERINREVTGYAEASLHFCQSKENPMENEEIRTAEVEKLSQSEKREQVFVSLFLSGFYEEKEKDEALSNYYEMQNFSAALTEQIRSRYLGVKEHLGSIDTMLQKYAIGWDLNRMGKAEISILRLAVYEILFDEAIPEKVAANEAVELAKKYGTNESYSFINGILGKVIASSHESGL